MRQAAEDRWIDGSIETKQETPTKKEETETTSNTPRKQFAHALSVKIWQLLVIGFFLLLSWPAVLAG